MTMTEPSVRLRKLIISDNLSITLRILKRFPDLVENIDPSNGWTNLHYASSKGHYLILSNLIKLIQLYHLDEQEVKLTFQKETYLHLSLGSNNEQTLHLLLQNYQPLIDYVQHQGRTLVHLSCQLDHSQCLQLLVDFGANLNIQDDNGDTPLHVLMQMGHVKCVKVLLQSSLNLELDLKNNQGFKCTDVANSFDTIKLFEFLKKNLENNNLYSANNSNGGNIVPQSVSVSANTTMSGSISGNSSAINTGGISSNINSITPVRSTHAYTVGGPSLPPLPSVTTSRRYSISNSPSMDNISLSSSGHSISTQLLQPLQQPVTPFASTPMSSRSRSTSLKSESSNNTNSAIPMSSSFNDSGSIVSSGKQLLPLIPKLLRNSSSSGSLRAQEVKSSNHSRKRANTLDDLDDIQEESNGKQMLQKLSEERNGSGGNSTRGSSILNIVIRGKNK